MGCCYSCCSKKLRKKSDVQDLLGVNGKTPGDDKNAPPTKSGSHKKANRNSYFSKYSFGIDHSKQRVSSSHENTTILMLDDYALGKVTSYLDTKSLHSVMLTCKRMNEVASNCQNWSRSTLFLKALYLLRNVLFFQVDDREIPALKDALIESKKLKEKFEVMTVGKVSDIWSRYGSEVAKLYCMIRDYNRRRSIHSNGKQIINRWLTVELPSGKTLLLRYQQVLDMNKVFQVSEEFHVTVKENNIPIYNSHPPHCHASLAVKREDPTSIQQIVELLNNELEFTSRALSWEFLKRFTKTISPLWCDRDVKQQKTLSQSFEDCDLLGVSLFENQQENKVPFDIDLGQTSANIREMFWKRFIDIVEKGMQRQRGTAIWRKEFEKLGKFIVEALPRFKAEQLGVLKTVMRYTSSMTYSICHGYSDYIVWHLVHKLVSKIKYESLREEWIDDGGLSSDERTIEFCLSGGRQMKVTGKPNSKSDFLTFAAPDKSVKISVDDLANENFPAIVKPIVNLVQQCVNEDFKEVYQHKPKVWDSLVIYFFILSLSLQSSRIYRLHLRDFEKSFRLTLDHNKGRKIERCSSRCETPLYDLTIKEEPEDTNVREDDDQDD